MAGVTAGISTGETKGSVKKVTEHSLINDPSEMRLSPPDILLTNYKMLDQLLLRPEDREIWRKSAMSLQYLVLDEFHTYVGAQGTDVALLLRRLGLMLKEHQPEGFLGAYVDDVETESLRAVIESGSFNQWRVYIHPEQRRMAEGARNGSSRVFGGAGTGKTVVAVRRANNLARRAVANQDPGDTPPAILLTTFTKGLAHGLKSQLNALNPHYPEASDPGEPGVWVDNIDAVVRKVVSLGTPDEVEEATRRVLGDSVQRVRPYTDLAGRHVWDAAIESTDESMPREIANDTFLQAEYETVVLANRITTLAEYLKVPRPGRGTPLNRKQRKQVWAVLESVMHTQAIDGQLFWPTMSAVGAEILNVRYGDGPRMFEHVLVDEAQDFNAGHWHFLRACVAEGPNDIFIAEDSHQRIYGNPLTLSHFGISTRGGASTRLTLNYRTTKQNLDYALRILLGGDTAFIDAEGAEDHVEHYRSARTGPAPEILPCTSEEQEFAAAAERINHWLDADNASEVRIGVMCRTRG